MSAPRKRSYRSELRESQARRTRASIVEAAAALFVAQGYGATTIQEVAEAAGVSRKTVFSSIGGKVELIKLAYDHAMGGDDEPIPMRDRPRVREMRALGDPAAMLTALAAVITDADTRIAPIYLALTGAAEIDTEARDLLDDIERQRLTGARFHAEHLATLPGAPREGLTPDTVVDIIWFCLDPTHYHQLVGRRGWSSQQFENWLGATLRTQLLTGRM